jgi:sulfate transport system substrate-binding protein
MTLDPRRRGALVATATVALAIGLTACSSSGTTTSTDTSAAGSGAAGSAATGDGSGGSVDIVAFSAPKPAYDALEAAFNQTPQGKGVKFTASYGPSGSQATAITENGQHADYVSFSLGADMLKLVPKYVAPTWDQNKAKGIVSTSVVVLCVRPGNPKHITSWEDLVKPGVKIVTPDPATSGSAKWNLLAAYEHVLQAGGTEAQAKDYLTKLFKNVVSKPDSGSDAMATFVQGQGDVLLSYENEAITSRAAGNKLDYVIPQQDLLIENPGAVTTNASAAAKRFLAYVNTPAAQKIFASKGFRPVDNIVQPGTVQGAENPSAPYPAVKQLLTVSKLGGWAKANDEFFGDNGLISQIESSAG